MVDKKKIKAGGYTIVELVVTIVIAGIIIPAVAIAISNLAALNYAARDQALASMIAQNKVESLRSTGYNSINSGTTSFTSDLPSTMGNPRSASYTVTMPTTGLKQIDVNISYSIYGQSKTVSYRTYIGELGVGQ